MSGSEYLSDQERAQATYLLRQVLDLRLVAKDALADALARESRACTALAAEIDQLETGAWESLTDSVRRFRSDILRRDMRDGREVFPVRAQVLNPVRVRLD